MTTKYRVKARPAERTYRCDGCKSIFLILLADADDIVPAATEHAATCSDLHWRNWQAACPSCKLYGRVARACPVCLGYGVVRDREGLE